MFSLERKIWPKVLPITASASTLCMEIFKLKYKIFAISQFSHSDNCVGKCCLFDEYFSLFVFILHLFMYSVGLLPLFWDANPADK